MAKKEITFEEAYPIIQHYVNYFHHSGKFYSIAHQYDAEDMVQSLCVKWLTNRYLDKFDPEVTSVRYFIMTGVKHFYIDTLRSQREALSLDEEIGEDGFTLQDVLTDSVDMEENTISVLSYEWLLNQLPNDTKSKIRVVTPKGEFKATMRVLATLLCEGYSQAEIASFFLNPKSGKPVTTGRIAQMVKELRGMVSEIYGLA